MLHFTHSVLLQKLLFFMQTTKAFSMGATRPHCVHYLVPLCIFREILTGPSLHSHLQWKQWRQWEKGSHIQAFYLFSSLTWSSPPSSSPSFAEILGSRHFQQGSRKFPSILCSSRFSSLFRSQDPTSPGEELLPLVRVFVPGTGQHFSIVMVPVCKPKCTDFPSNTHLVVGSLLLTQICNQR